MRIFFYIIAHKLPVQLKLLVDLLSAEGDEVHIHIDRKSDIEAFKAHLPPSSNVHYVGDRRSVHWGGYSQVECVLLGQRFFLKSNCDYFILLSGQDLPIKPLRDLRNYLAENQGKLFLQFDTAERNWGKGHKRVAKFYFVDRWASLKVRMPRIKPVINKIEAVFHHAQFFVRRRFGKQIFGGSSWFVIPREPVQYIVDHMREGSQMERFFRFTMHPDEMLFHTILGHSPWRNEIRPGLTYARFEGGNSNPNIIWENDIDALLKYSGFFARKFDIETDKSAITQILRKHDKGKP